MKEEPEGRTLTYEDIEKVLVYFARHMRYVNKKFMPLGEIGLAKSIVRKLREYRQSRDSDEISYQSFDFDFFATAIPKVLSGLPFSFACHSVDGYKMAVIIAEGLKEMRAERKMTAFWYYYGASSKEA